MSTKDLTEQPYAPDQPADSPSRGNQFATMRAPSQNTGLRPWARFHLPYLTIAILWISTIFAVTRVSSLEVLNVSLGMLLLGLPMYWAGLWKSAVRRRRLLSAWFRHQGWLYTVLSGHWLSKLYWIAIGLVMSFFLLLQVHVYVWVEWAVLAATIPIFTVIFGYLKHQSLKEELHADTALSWALMITRWTCPAVVLVLHVAAMAWWGDIPKHASIEAAIVANTPEATDRSGSALVREMLLWGSLLKGIKEFVLSQLAPRDGLWSLLTMALLIGNYLLLYYVCLALSCFRIPRTEFVRPHIMPRSKKDVFKTVFIAAFLVSGILVPLEAWVARSPELPQFRTNVKAEITPIVRLVVEQIDNEYYRQGTHEQITRARSEATLSVGVAEDQFRNEVAVTFDRLENEAVDEYLDWYYSLPADWMRLANIIIGGEEGLYDYLAEETRKRFDQGKWYESIDKGFRRLTVAGEEARGTYEQAVRAILERNQVDSRQLLYADLDVVSNTSLEEIFKPVFQQDFVPAVYRILGASGVGMGVGTIIAGKVNAKIRATHVLKVSWRKILTTLGKRVGTRAAQGGAQIAGAALGSTVFGLGAVAGAAAGGAAAIAIEHLLLKLEEEFNRDDFRHQIVSAIREARREFDEHIFGGGAAPKQAGPREMVPP